MSKYKQFSLYSRETIFHGNSPQITGQKIWVDIKAGICQFSDKTKDLNDVNWVKFNKFK